MNCQSATTPRIVAAIVLLAVLALASASHAFAAQPVGHASGMGGSAEGLFVAEIVLLLLVGRGLGEIFQRYGQPAIMGQLIGGILLGPSLFGWLWPDAQHLIFSTDPAQKSMIDAVSQLGILLLLLLTGMETDLRLVRRVGAACFSISITGIIVPFACGFALAQFLPATLLPEPTQRIVAGLFLGTALSISSVKIVAMVVREMNFMRRNLGQVIISSAIIEDTIGWLIIAITFGIATNGSLQVLPLLTTVAEVALFMVFSFTLGRRLVFTLIRWSNDSFRSEYAVITVILIIMGVMALITNLIGVHTVLGAFVAGILVGESPILSDHIEGQLRGVITALFMPIFFGMAGLSADLTVLTDPTLALLTLALVAIASIGKFGGAFIGGRLAGMSLKEAIAVGSAMNARGSTEVIVASIGLSMNILSHNLFTMIVTMAVITTLAMPPMLRWALGRLPVGHAEKQRVERELLDERGFVSKLERLLLLVDDSPVGKFTAYLAGLVGGGSGMPTTLLHLKDGRIAGPAGDKGPERARNEVRKGAARSARAVSKAEDTSVEKVHLTTRTKSEATADTIAQEARKGYGLLLVGLETMMTAKGSFTGTLNDITGGFDGPLCLVLNGAKSAAKMPVLKAGTTILVPVNGTEVSRRAADFALALARPHRARVKVLYVSQAARQGATSVSHRREEAMLKDIADLAARYGVQVDTALRTRATPDRAIAREVAKGAAMVVMGVTQRPGEELFFGDTATAVLAAVACPVVLLASERIRPTEARTEAGGGLEK
ncbi:Kef-type K+ transport system, membrane component KefB [Mesorhizobium qingshengii]|uniref:Kef-type K+ transport system, membrane component KefB n=2 Tax=Mesorhizobium qingshengii TaxID=1165689 RepID=A0A1G5ZNC7_9HYPH|nr:cation:proton antiporter [Mesorhizobium qingshengii]SDA96319.1 Kef-type K+ transport system, membrane component KefB [Mesorhizobium qingshengii]